jgi:hypothetical protein
MSDKETGISHLKNKYPGIEILEKPYTSFIEPYGFRWIKLY